MDNEGTTKGRKRGRKLRLTEEQVDAAAGAAARGDSQAVIAERFGVCVSTISAALGRREGFTPRRRRRVHRSPGSDGAAAVEAAALAALEPGDDARARVVSALDSTRAFAAGCKAEGDHAGFARLVQLEAKLARQLATLDAARPPDPALDPANRAARDTVIALIRSMVADPAASEAVPRD